MNPTGTQYTVWAISFLSHAIVALGMVRFRSHRRWPFLFAMAWFEVALTVVLFSMTGNAHYRQYFYIYWSAEILRGLLVIGLLWNIVRSIPGIKSLPLNLGIIFASIAFAISTASALLASQAGTKTFPITMMALTMDRCITVIWGTSSLSIFAALWYCGIGWKMPSIRIASGYLAITVIRLVETYFLSVCPTRLHPIHEFSDIGQAAIWIYWLLALVKEVRGEDQTVIFEKDPSLTEALILE